MTDYALQADVSARIPDVPIGGTFTGSTTPTAVQVDAFIDLIEGEINSILISHGYVAPVVLADDPQAFDWVKGAVISRAVVDVLNMKPGAAFDPDNPTPQTDRKSLFWANWIRILDMITLETFQASRDVNRAETFVVGSAKTSTGDIKDPVFSRGMWDFPGGPGARGRTSKP